jgi:hypothetical protein
MQIMDDLIRTGIACDHQVDHDVVVDSCRSAMTLPALRDQLVSRNVDFFRDDLLAVSLLDVRVGPRGIRGLRLDPDCRAEVAPLLHELSTTSLVIGSTCHR